MPETPEPQPETEGVTAPAEPTELQEDDVPSTPRPKGLAYAPEPSQAAVDRAMALAAETGAELPEGASVPADAPKGLWYALVDGDGNTVTDADGNPVRVP